MKPTLAPGLTFEFVYEVPATKTVPHLFPEAKQFQQMPDVLATGYLVGLIEWACIEAVNPHIEWPDEQTVGIHVELSHSAATPPGFTVTVKGRLTAVEGRKLTFQISAEDGVDKICEGTHKRFVIETARFDQNLHKKIETGTSH
ncbi:MAG TPA: thioesterase family protein [Desulfobacterales bacterium]